MNGELNKAFSFGEFEVDPSHRLLVRQGEPVNLSPKAFDLLLTLVENHGRVLSKNDLLDMVWENQFVEENNLTVHVAALRKALGETKNEHRFIVTVPGKGYRFVAPLNQPAGGEIVVESRRYERIVVEEEIETHSSGAETYAVAPERLTVPGIGQRRNRILFAAALPALLVMAALGYWLYNRNAAKPALAMTFGQMSFNRLTASGKINSSAISRDGNYFVYAQTEAEGQSLWVRQVAESRSVQLMPADAVEYWGLTFSPEGTQIYCTVFTAKQADPKLIRIPTLGGVVEDLPNVPCSGISFSPDGKRFAYVVSSSGSGGTLLRTANADGTDDQVLTLLKEPSYFVYPGPTVSWSPDGRTIACSAKIVDETGDHGAVLAVDVSDGKMSTLTTRAFPWVESVSWTPDGKGVIITANEDASSPMQIWHQPLPPGEAKKLTNDLTWYSSVGTTSDGKEIIATEQTTTSSLWMADYTGEVGPARQIANEIGDYGEIGWTADGKVIYRSSATGKQNLWTMHADGTEQTQITTDAMPDKGLDVSRDGRYIVFSSNRAGQYNLWRANTDGTNIMRLTDGRGEVFPRITPDSQWVIYQRGVGEIVSTLWKVPIEGGTSQQITSGHSLDPALSPDGRFVSYFYMDTSRTTKGEWRIAIASVDDGSMVRSFLMPENTIGRVVRWAPDNSSIVYAKKNGSVGNLWKQTLDQTAPVRITDFARETIADFAWSKDGKWLAFVRGQEIRDVVLIGNGSR